ncbi:unnamed protein product, partial [Ranitomeya imitator]
MCAVRTQVSQGNNTIQTEGIFHIKVPESSPVRLPIGRIRAVDPDFGKNAEIEYNIVPGDGGNLFDIITDNDTQEGILMLKKILSFTVETHNRHLRLPTTSHCHCSSGCCRTSCCNCNYAPQGSAQLHRKLRGPADPQQAACHLRGPADTQQDACHLRGPADPQQDACHFVDPPIHSKPLVTFVDPPIHSKTLVTFVTPPRRVTGINSKRATSNVARIRTPYVILSLTDCPPCYSLLHRLSSMLFSPSQTVLHVTLSLTDSSMLFFPSQTVLHVILSLTHCPPCYALPHRLSSMLFSPSHTVFHVILALTDCPSCYSFPHRLSSMLFSPPHTVIH